MKLAAVKLYAMVISSGLVLLAALLLLLLQWGNAATLTLYGPSKNVNTLLLMLLSAVGGVAIWSFLKLFWRGAVGLRRLPRDA